MHKIVLVSYESVMLISGIDLKNQESIHEQYPEIEVLGHAKI